MPASDVRPMQTEATPAGVQGPASILRATFHRMAAFPPMHLIRPLRVLRRPQVEGEFFGDRLTSGCWRRLIGDHIALDYTHRHGVIHRHIKPENILLNDGSALVADFGIARAASEAGSRMTETVMSLGTPQYMSPEQAMGDRELGGRVSSFGGLTPIRRPAGERLQRQRLSDTVDSANAFPLAEPSAVTRIATYPPPGKLTGISREPLICLSWLLSPVLSG